MEFQRLVKQLNSLVRFNPDLSKLESKEQIPKDSASVMIISSNDYAELISGVGDHGSLAIRRISDGKAWSFTSLHEPCGWEQHEVNLYLSLEWLKNGHATDTAPAWVDFLLKREGVVRDLTQKIGEVLNIFNSQ